MIDKGCVTIKTSSATILDKFMKMMLSNPPDGDDVHEYLQVESGVIDKTYPGIEYSFSITTKTRAR